MCIFCVFVLFLIYLLLWTNVGGLATHSWLFMIVQKQLLCNPNSNGVWVKECCIKSCILCKYNASFPIHAWKVLIYMSMECALFFMHEQKVIISWKFEIDFTYLQAQIEIQNMIWVAKNMKSISRGFEILKYLWNRLQAWNLQFYTIFYSYDIWATFLAVSVPCACVTR